MKRSDLQRVIEVERQLDQVEDKLKKLQGATTVTLKFSGTDVLELAGVSDIPGDAKAIFDDARASAYQVLAIRAAELGDQLKDLGVEL